MNGYPNSIVFHLLILDKEFGWSLNSVYPDFNSAKAAAARFQFSNTCRIDEVSYRNVFQQPKKNGHDN